LVKGVTNQSNIWFSLQDSLDLRKGSFCGTFAGQQSGKPSQRWAFCFQRVCVYLFSSNPLLGMGVLDFGLLWSLDLCFGVVELVKAKKTTAPYLLVINGQSKL